MPATAVALPLPTSAVSDRGRRVAAVAIGLLALVGVGGLLTSTTSTTVAGDATSTTSPDAATSTTSTTTPSTTTSTTASTAPSTTVSIRARRP